MAVFTVLGAGMMGSALCVPLVDGGHEVRLVGTHLDEAIIKRLRQDGVHPKMAYSLPGGICPLPFSEFDEAMQGADFLALGVSSAGLSWAAEQLAPHARAERPVFMITKGLDWDGERLRALPDVVGRHLPPELRGEVQVAAIAGPCIAGELARRVPTCVVLTGRDPATLNRIAGAIRSDYYHVFTSTDLIGTEVCAALKNAYAMGVALGAGIHEGRGGAAGSVAMHNYESAVFAQALFEMECIVRAMGGKPETVAGLAGAGDLDVTNNGGRTGRFGRLLGMGLSVEQAIEKMDGATLECLEIIAVMREATAVMRDRGQLAANELPLLDHLAEVVLDGASVALPFGSFFGGTKS